MKSVDVKDFQYALETFIAKNELPLECKRVILKQIYDDIKAKADAEVFQQLQEREAEERAKKEAPIEKVEGEVVD